jgi:hypothetical protein
MLLEKIRAPQTQTTQKTTSADYVTRSTDLTVYEVCELLDGNNQGTGIFRLARKSLEPGLPFAVYCDHSHATAHEASKCTFFASPAHKNTAGDQKENDEVTSGDLAGLWK